MVIKALSYSVLEVGKIVKKSKKRFVWKFMIDGYEHTVELRASHISGKRKVIYNNEMIHEGKKKINSSFQFPFQIDVNMCTVIQKGENYDLKINNLSFDQLEGGENFRNATFNFDQAPAPQSNQRYETIDDQRRPSQTMASYPTEPIQPSQPSKPKKEVEHIEPQVKPQKPESKSGFGFFKSKPKDSKAEKEAVQTETIAKQQTEEEKPTLAYRAPFQLKVDSSAASALRGVRHKVNQENDSNSVNQLYNKNPTVNYNPSPVYLYGTKNQKDDDGESNYDQYGNNW